MIVTPPLGDERLMGEQTCGRIIGINATGELHCNLLAIEHIAWTVEMENGLTCEKHYAEAKQQWAYYDHHPIGGLCCKNENVKWIPSWVDAPGYYAEVLVGNWLYHESYNKIEQAELANSQRGH